MTEGNKTPTAYVPRTTREILAHEAALPYSGRYLRGVRAKPITTGLFDQVDAARVEQAAMQSDANRGISD